MIMSVFEPYNDLDAKQSIDYIVNLEKVIRQNCSKEEQLPLRCGSAVARYTIVYWSENLPKWLNVIMGDKASIVVKSDDWRWKDFGGADVSGAVAGAVAGAIGGALVGGVGAGPGAVAGGLGVGIGNSAGYAVEKAWDWLWE